MIDSTKKLTYKSGHILVAGFVMIVLSWVLNAAFHTIGLHEKSFSQEIFAPSNHEAWERLLTVFVITVFILYVNYITQGRDRLANELHEAMLKARRDENNIRNLNEKLAQRAAQLAVTNKELEAFSSSVSHDLRAPLTRIYSAGQLIRDLCRNNLDEDGQHLVQTICEGCEQMEELIEALLGLACVASGELNRTPCDISGIARLVVAELQLSDLSRQVRFQIEEGLSSHADARLVRVVMENLLGNAWKYTQKTPEAQIEFGGTEAEGRKIYFVRDNGAGFAMENAHKLFKPFQRLHDSADFKGTGIGLATVQRIVDRHGGQVWCKGEEGRGATFYFTLNGPPFDGLD